MKNADKPAMPVHEDWTAAENMRFTGLTKREYIAIAVLQGILCNGATQAKPHLSHFAIMCENSITIADELLKHLEKK